MRSGIDLYGQLYGTHAMREMFSAHERIAAMLRFEVALARAEIQRARSLSDPRYLGRAQATLGRWWSPRRASTSSAF